LAIYAFIRLFIHSIQLVLASLNLTMEQFFTTLQRVEEAGLRAFPSELWLSSSPPLPEMTLPKSLLVAPKLPVAMLVFSTKLENSSNLCRDSTEFI